MTKLEIIRLVAYAMVPNGALLMVKDNPCQGESTIRPLNGGGMLLAQAQLFEQHLQEVMQDDQEVTPILFEKIHLEIRLYFWRILDILPGDIDYQRAVVELNRKTIARLKDIALQLRIEYVVSQPFEPLQD